MNEVCYTIDPNSGNDGLIRKSFGDMAIHFLNENVVTERSRFKVRISCLNPSCSLTECLNNEDGTCDLINPISLKAARQDDKTCPFMETDIKLEHAKIKSAGGISALIREDTKQLPKKVVDKTEAKKQWVHKGYTIKRLASRAYEVFNQQGKKIHAKPVMLKFLLELDDSLDPEVWKKKGTRPIGNNLIKLL